MYTHVLYVVQAGLASLNAQSNSLYNIQQVSIISARVQVVAGLKYEIEINAGLSSCPKMSMIANTLEACPVNNPERYVLIIVDKSWATPRYTLIEHTVTSIPPVAVSETTTPPATTTTGPTSSCLGCSSASDISLEAMAAAREGIKLFNSVCDASAPFVITTITSVTSQVVAGTLYRIHFKGGQGTCLDGTVGTPEEKQVRQEAWLKQGLAIGTVNGFGDALDTMYTGGTPLFNEITGQQIDINEYLTAQHQDNPWDSLCTVSPEQVADYSMVVWDQPWRTPNRFELQSHSLPTMKKGGGDGNLSLETSAQASSSHENDAKSLRIFRVLGISSLLAGLVGYGFYALKRGDGGTETMTEGEHTQISQQEEEEGEEVGLSKGTEMKASV